MSQNSTVKTDNPLVSVIVPTYNRAEFIMESVGSVLNQTYKNLEIIIVDDASPDNTAEVIQAIDDDRVRYVCNEKNSGPAVSRNHGIDVATGDYLCFLDDDDNYLPHKIEVLLNELHGTPPAVGLAYSRVRYVINGEEKVGYPTTGSSGDVYGEVLAGNWFHPNSTLIKKYAVARYDETLPSWEDVDFHIQMVKNYHAIFVNNITCTYFMDDDRFGVSRKPRGFQDAFEIMEKRYFSEGLKTPYPEAYVTFLLRVGGGLVKLDAKASRKYFKKALKIKFSLKPAVYLTMSYLGSGLFYRLHAGLLSLKWKIKTLIYKKEAQK